MLPRTPPRGGPPPPRGGGPSARDRAKWGEGGPPKGGRRKLEERPPWVDINEPTEPNYEEDYRAPLPDRRGVPQQYQCKNCLERMSMEEREQHHQARGPCQLVRCGYCRNPILRGKAEEHKQVCTRVEVEKAAAGGMAGMNLKGREGPPPAGAGGGGGHEVARRAVGGGPPPRHESPTAPENGRRRANSEDLGATLNRQPCYVGDRVLVSGRQAGEVMFVGAVEGMPGTSVGVKLDHPAVNAHDGKTPQGMRYFRCKAGHGVFVSISQVQQVPSNHPLAQARAASPSHPQSGPSSHLPRSRPDTGQRELVKRGEKWEKQLFNLVGMTQVKEKIVAVRNSLEVNERRAAAGGRSERPAHLCLVGNPGSGRTGAALVLGQMLAAHDYTRGGPPQPHGRGGRGPRGPSSGPGLVAPPRQEVFHNHSVSRTQELLEKVLENAKGGVLLLDDLSAVAASSEGGGGSVSSTGKEILELFASEVARVNKDAGTGPGIVLVCTGDTTLMASVLRGCPNLRGLLGTPIELPDLNADEVSELFVKFARERGFQAEPGITQSSAVNKHITQMLSRADKDHRNAHLASQLLDDAVKQQTERVHAMGTISKASLLTIMEYDLLPQDGGGNTGAGDQDSEKQLQQCNERLQSVVGLKGVKEFVTSMRAQIVLDQERRAAGLPSVGQGTLHMVFSGNPGTGKTTVARIIASMFQALGVLRKGQMVEVERSSLVAGYSGQTAIKTKEVVESALGGILFVDEAYTLVNGERDSFGKEAIDTILKMMEDFRDDLVVIFAGYKKEMSTLMQSNSGLASRFPTWLHFDDYTAKELMQIALNMLQENKMHLTPEAQEILYSAFEKMSATAKEQAEANTDPEDPSSRPSNGRAVRNILEQVQRKQAVRLAEQKTKKSMEDLTTIVDKDVSPCVASLL